MTKIYSHILLIGLLLFGGNVFGQLTIGTASVANTQNFDGMGNSGTATLPTGFKIGTDWSTGTTATTLAYGTTGTGAVTSTSGGGAINWANGVTASSTDRGLGFLSTSGYTSPRSIIFAFTNNTGSTVTSLDISFDYEKYRSGTRAFDWNFFHGSTSTAATAATSGDQAYSADANNTTIFNPPTSISKSFSITGLSIANGSTYYLRWTYTGNGGSTNGQGLGIDNFSITLTTSAPTNTITTSTSISGSPFCVTASTGAAVSVDFTSTGTFTSNTYTAQLSNASGSFASPVNIGTLSSNANLGTINATIPANTATGTGYRIRVISNGPSATGTDNGTNLTINLAANAVAPSTAQNIATGANGATLTVTEQSSPTSRVWKYGTSSGTHPTSTGITGTTYTPNFATAGTYYVVCESTYPCGVIKSNEVIITVVNAPANDNCNNAISLTVNSSETCTSTTSGTLLNASSSIAAINCGGNTGTANDDVWYTFKATATSHIISVTPSNSWDVVVEVLSGSCNGTNINCADAFAASTTPEVITLTGLTINSDYLVRIYSYNSTTPATPTFTVCVTTPPPVCLFEGFEGASPPSGWTYSSITQNTNNPRTGSYSAIFNGNNDEMISPMIATPGTLSFWYKRSGTAPGSPAFLVYYGSSTTGPWTQIGSTIASFSTTYQEFTADLSSQSNIYIRILHTRSSGTNEIYLDDFSVSCNSCTAPTNPNGTISGATTACGSSILSYTHGSGQPLSGVSYFWQTSPTGTSTTLNTTDDFEITGSGNYYVRAKKDGEACWSAGATAAYAVTIINTTTSISPTADQNLITGNNGTQLTVTEGSTTSSRQWMYSTTSGSGYQTISGQTGLNYIPNFASAGVYYVVCASTYSTCGTIITNEVKINVAAPGPPVITHTPLINTTSTSTQTATVTISSTTAITCATLTYRVDGGSWQTPVNGTLSGGLYSFPIPGQVAGSMIEYFITACNSAGTVTSPNGVSTSSPYGSFHEYTINCTPPSSGTQTIAFQGFEFVSSSSYTFSVDNTNTAPTDALKQNYPAHPNAIEWRYFNQKPNGSLTDATRNSCGCMAETFSGLPGCPNPSNPVYSAGGSTGICRTFSGNSRGVYGSTTATENPANSRSRNGSYSYIQISRNDGGDGPISFIYFDDVTIPDAANATNIKVIAYVSSISTSVTNNGAESADYVTLSAAYNSTGTPNNMVNDITCGSDWYFYSSDISATVTGSTNQRWDFAGNLWNTTPAISGTTSKNKIVLSIPNGTTNVRAMIKILNDDGNNNELWAIDDVQVIADYPLTAPTSGRYYRSRQNGKWNAISTWEVATAASGPYSNACEFPTYSNSDSIIIMPTHTVRITADQTADQLRIAENGKLVVENRNLTIYNATGTDMVVNGTLEDNCVTNSVSFNSGATWSYTSTATIIKTSSSSVVTYRDNYAGGISNIPADANWYYSYKGVGVTNTVTVGMFYPNLYFENAFNTGNYSFNTSASALTGTTGGFCTVKGNLFVGTTGAGTVTLLNNNTNTQPMLVNGNITVGANSTFTNASYNGGSSSSHGNGTGIEVKGNVTVNGILDINTSSTGILKFSGTGTQTVAGTGTIDLWNVELNKPAQTLVDLDRNLTVNNRLHFNNGGIIKTDDFVFSISNGDIANAITGFEAPFTATTGAPTYNNDKYVWGNLERTLNTTGIYTFPVGDAVAGEGYNPVRLNRKTGTGNATAAFIPGDPGICIIGPIFFSCNGVVKFFQYSDMTSEGKWRFTSSTSTNFTYDIYLHPNQSNTNTHPNDDVSADPLFFRNNYRALKAPNGTTDWSSYAGDPTTCSTCGDICEIGTYYNIPGIDYTGFSDFAPGGGNGNTTALPVELTHFAALCNDDNSITVKWSTASERNSKEFILERSDNGINYIAITKIPAAGNSSQPRNYSFTDNSPFNPTYYRLKQVDLDGSVQQFNATESKCGNNVNGVSIYVQNDGSVVADIQHNSNESFNFSLYQFDGKLITSENRTIENGFNRILLTEKINQLAKGIYILRISGGITNYTKKILIQ